MITIFTKPGCPYCAKAKDLLHELGEEFIEHDIETGDGVLDQSIFLSGRSTVPQIFIGDYHVNGSDDLARLAASGELNALLEAGVNDNELALASPAAAHQGAEDMLAREHIAYADRSTTDEQDEWPILRLYKEFFGFWPNCFGYMAHWPEAYKEFVYCHNYGAIRYREVIGMPMMSAVGYATSNAQGCSYCQVHSSATGGEKSGSAIEMLKQAQDGQGGKDNPFGPFEVALADLAAKSSVNEVSPGLLSKIRELQPQARISQEDADKQIEGVSMIVSAFGFLNVFNDLTGVEIEGGWAESAKDKNDIDAGRHGAGSDNPANLDYDLPEGGPSIDDLIHGYEQKVGGNISAFAEKNLGLMPSWITSWPKQLRAHHAYFYCEMMQTREHSEIDSELKHLMARVSAIAKGNAYLAGVEGYLAWIAGDKTDAARDRVKDCFALASGRAPVKAGFSERERAALRLSWLSAQTPLVTPRKYLEPIFDQFTQRQAVELFIVCAMASMLQRYTSIALPGSEPEVAEWLSQNDIAQGALALRYPIPVS